MKQKAVKYRTPNWFRRKIKYQGMGTKKYNHVLISPNEISLKGHNQDFFRKKLMANIYNSFKSKQLKPSRAKFYGSSLLLTFKEPITYSIITELLGAVFGVSSIYPCHKTVANLNVMANEIMDKELKGPMSKKEIKNFALKSRRSDKSFKYNSNEINNIVGKLIKDRTKLDVNLENPDALINIVVLNKNNIYFSPAGFRGAGGLPASSAGRVVCMISGGIDSCVAAYFLAKRGAENIFIHFHSYPRTDRSSIRKVKKLIKQLARYQAGSRLILVPYLNIQKQIVARCREKYRTILYRRFSYKIAELIAQEMGALGLVSGDSLGQVASQTLENILVVSSGIKLPIYRPLIGMDKQEIINIAKSIGTYTLSIEPQQDPCTLFAPLRPATRAKLADVLREEEKLNTEDLIKKTLERVEEVMV